VIHDSSFPLEVVTAGIFKNILQNIMLGYLICGQTQFVVANITFSYILQAIKYLSPKPGLFYSPRELRDE